MSWEPIDLAKLEPRPVSFPSIGGVNLIYPGKRHVFSGAPESAKTIAAYAIMLEEIRLGGNVLLIDFEMGPWDARERLSLLVNRSGDGTTACPSGAGMSLELSWTRPRPRRTLARLALRATVQRAPASKARRPRT